MNIERLKTLRDFLRSMPTELVWRFDMRSWAGNENIPFGGKPDLSCGTSACACGFATTIPSFRDAGFRLVRAELDNDKNFEATIEYVNEEGVVLQSFEAVRNFFEIDDYYCNYMFADYRYDREPKEITPTMVADRIDEVIRVGSRTSL